MRVSFIGLLLFFVLLGVQAYASTLTAHGSLTYSTPLWDDDKKTFLTFFPSFKVVYNEEGDVSAGFEVEHLLLDMWAHGRPTIKHLPDYQAFMKQQQAGTTIESFRLYLDQKLFKRTRFRSYMIQISPSGNYTECVGVGGEGGVIKGEAARAFLKDEFFSDDALYPLFFAFRMTQRFVSPEGLLPSIFKSIFDKRNTVYTKEEFKGPGGYASTKFRVYHYDIPNDKHTRYTTERLEKLFTIPPNKISPENSDMHTELDPVTLNTHQHTPVKSVVARFLEDNETGQLSPIWIIFSSRLIPSHEFYPRGDKNTILWYRIGDSNWK
eukprot:GDKI01035075.1.p1 GENE.GDKI01035075.1~~GDKI01035075.1.p1  ORF type:complete len:323 (+),score=40.76 GDKI01035075.1:141-1109(+)